MLRFSDSENNSSDDNDDVIKDDGLSSKLAAWAVPVAFQIPQNAVSSLLEILNIYHPKLPRDSRTLLRTPRHCDVKEIAGGSYTHLGIKSSLVR